MGSAATRTDTPSTIHVRTIQRIAGTLASRFIRENCTGVHTARGQGLQRTIGAIPGALSHAAERVSSSWPYSFPSEASKRCAERRSARPRSLLPAECGYSPSVPTHHEWAGKLPADPGQIALAAPV